MQLFTLDQQDVTDILKSLRSNPPVVLAALDCNWGAPVPGRFDTDFLNVWAAAATSIGPRRVTLYGTHSGSAWDVQADLERVSTVGGMELYSVSLASQTEFPREFVIRAQGSDGTFYYDNNGGYGANYRLQPFHGRVTSAVRGDPAKTGPGAPRGAIWNLSHLTPCQLVARTGGS